ncbi:YdcF family protein [Bacillus sp. JJ1122]|uniref:YdcF family protein n=1 Tax=Bacillus sp. JJ1122 TaxID=3122951 RepID=UPI002FFDAE70
MKISALNPNTLSDEQITKLLFGEFQDDQKPGDCIIVLGSSKAIVYRLPVALQLYKAGRADKILFSGGVTWPGNNLTEAALLKNKAIAAGIPEDKILVEDVSKNTKENVLASLLVLDRWLPLHKIRRLLIVTSSYHIRRTYLTFKTYMPDWIEFTLCPADDQNTCKDNWFLSPYGRQRAVNEAKKIIEYIGWGAIVDDEF